MTYAPHSYTCSFIVENTSNNALEFTFDARQSQSMNYSNGSGVVSKVINAHDADFMLRAEVAPGATSFSRAF